MIDWWHGWRLRSAEVDYLVALGKLASMQETWCQWTRLEAEAEKLIAEGRIAYHRIHLGLNPFTGVNGTDAASHRSSEEGK